VRSVLLRCYFRKPINRALWLDLLWFFFCEWSGVSFPFFPPADPRRVFVQDVFYASNLLVFSTICSFFALALDATVNTPPPFFPFFFWIELLFSFVHPFFFKPFYQRPKTTFFPTQTDLVIRGALPNSPGRSPTLPLTFCEFSAFRH